MSYIPEGSSLKTTLVNFMQLTPDAIAGHNEKITALHQRQYQFLAETLHRKGLNVENLLTTIQAFQIAIPSWALGTGGTRFGRYPGAANPATWKKN